ncbi:sirohydrochlorin chelatase [Salinifilum ghardaiensis]
MTAGDVPLVAVAHGSRDPRSAATIHALMDEVRRQSPDLDVRTAFLDLSAPRVGDVLAGVHGDGHEEAVVVPLLLGHAFHARVDVPGAVADAEHRHPRFRARIAEVLGPDPRLERAAWRRLAAAGAEAGDPELGVVLAGAGSSHPPANRIVEEVTERWCTTSAWPDAAAAFAAAAEPTVPQAIARLRAAGARRIAVGAWFLAPGLLPDRILEQARAEDPEALLAAPMADDAEVAALVLARYRAALAAPEEHESVHFA